jgi:hypothetical protein
MRSSIGGICFDISELGRSFVEFKITWVSRDANSVAHCCARLVSATKRVLFWLDYGPVHLAYNPSYSACFFSRNSIFLS